MRPLHETLSEPARCVRVTSLLVGTACMSLADLYMTLLFATHVGMLESNPVARMVMAHDSPALVVLWKVALTVFGVGVLFYSRRKRHAEIATWLVFAVLCGLMAHWLLFTEAAREAGADYHLIAMSGDARWVEFPAD
ncbi:MAG: DUF5658 family protein [Planctomycetota bacterium]|nr:DUF5658 family protein [Planctomycetota bacterium]